MHIFTISIFLRTCGIIKRLEEKILCFKGASQQIRGKPWVLDREAPWRVHSQKCKVKVMVSRGAIGLPLIGTIFKIRIAKKLIVSTNKNVFYDFIEKKKKRTQLWVVWAETRVSAWDWDMVGSGARAWDLAGDARRQGYRRAGNGDSVLKAVLLGVHPWRGGERRKSNRASCSQFGAITRCHTRGSL